MHIYANEMFTLRTMILCTMNDYPAYRNLSGYETRGKQPCPICIEYMKSTHLKVCKHIYIPTRRLLGRDHPYRFKKHTFNGTVEEEVARRPLTGIEVYNQDKGIETIFGKLKSEVDGPTGLWKKESIFQKLLYWKDLEVRLCLDVMHIEKNVCEAILMTLMNILGKTKGVKASRLYLEKYGLRQELWAQKRDKRKKKVVKERVDEETRKRKKEGRGFEEESFATGLLYDVESWRNGFFRVVV